MENLYLSKWNELEILVKFGKFRVLGSISSHPYYCSLVNSDRDRVKSLLKYYSNSEDFKDFRF